MNSRKLVSVFLLGSLSSPGWASNEPSFETLAAPPLSVSTALSSDQAFYSASNSSGELGSPYDSVADFIREILPQDPRVQAARLNYRASESLALAAAKPLYNPELALESERAEEDTRSIGISQTLDWGGKRKARKAVGAAEKDAARAAYELVQQEVATDLLSRLAVQQTNAERGTLNQKRAQVMQNFLDLAKKRFDAGDLPLVEFNFAKMVYSQARMDNATVSADLIESQQQLRRLSNQADRDAWPTLETEFPVIATSVESFSIAALPIVQAAQFRVAASKADALLKKRERRTDPTIGVVGGEEGDSSLFGLTLSIPIPIRNSFRNEVYAANDLYLREVQALTAVERQASARLISAQKRVQIAQSAWQEWQQVGEQSISQQTGELKRLWTLGELSTTDYLIQVGQTLDSQESALSLRHALWEAWFEWLGASGQTAQWLNLTDSNSALLPTN